METRRDIIEAIEDWETVRDAHLFALSNREYENPRDGLRALTIAQNELEAARYRLIMFGIHNA